ncbi:MAG: hypothetical protein IPK26_11585 [Planctomycetes bacterium]|nr:hypothetical protein [Planctomycetota bacterium]
MTGRANRYIRDLQMLAGGAALFLTAGLLLIIVSPMPAGVFSLVLGLFLATLLALAVWFAVRGQSVEARDRMRAACKGRLEGGRSPTLDRNGARGWHSSGLCANGSSIAPGCSGDLW